MPKSNSDADENESLTSDEEALSPTVGRVGPHDARSAPAPLNGNHSNSGNVSGDRVNLLSSPQQSIAKFRSSVHKV